MDKIKTVKIKEQDGSISEESYFISVDAKNVDMDNKRQLQETIGNIDIDNDGNIATQLKNKINKVDIIDNLDSDNSNKVLSAKQGKVLGDSVSSLNNNVNKKVYYFNTIADMKNANLKNGDVVQTLGYYEINDNGGAIYKITDTQSEIEYQEDISNGLYATLVIENEINVKQFGAYGDGIHDDTLLIQKALNNAHTIYFDDGIYMVDVSISIKPKSNTKMILSKNAVIKALPSSSKSYILLNINNIINFEIYGGTISGDRVEHTGTGGEWGHCVSVNSNSNNIFIHDINIINAWGDGLYLNICDNVKTQNIHINNVRRNGCSIISATNYHSINDTIENSNGTSPQGGLDIEPNLDTDIINNLIFDNLSIKNCEGNGFIIDIRPTYEDLVVIKCNNLLSDGNQRGLTIGTPDSLNGLIEINNPIIINQKLNGGLINLGINTKMILNNPIIDTYGLTTYRYGLYSSGAGSLKIYNPIVKNGNSDTPTSIYFEPDVITNNCSIINPIELDGRVVLNNVANNFVISDLYNLLTEDLDASQRVTNIYHSRYTSNTFSENRQILVINASTLIGYETEFINTGEYAMTVRFVDAYIYPLSTSVNRTVTLANKGDSIKVKKIADSQWIIINMIGNVTSN